jgi:hypothetical protein
VRRKRNVLASGSACALALAVSGAALAAGADSAKADTIIGLPSGVTYLKQIVPDPQGGSGYLFTAANGEIIATSLSGRPVATIDSGDGIGALALSPGGGTLYAAVTSGTDAGSVAAITVSSIADATPAQAFYPLATGDQPSSLAVQSGKVWVSYSATAGGVTTVQIGAIDLAKGGAFEPMAAPGTWAGNVQLAADPDDAGVLAAVDYQSPAEAATYNTGTDPATALAAQGELGSAGTDCGYLGQLAVMPGGQRFAAACMGAAAASAYSTTSLATGVASYNANGSGTSQTVGIAVDADGSVAVANRTKIYVYNAGGTLINTLKLPTGAELDEGNGLAWVDTAGKPGLAAAYGMGDAPPYAVEIFSQAELQRPTTLTLTASGPAGFGRPVTLKGTSVVAGPAGSSGDPSPVTITRTGPGGAETLTVTPSGSGAFTVTDTPKAAGAYSYTASVGPVSSAAVTVKVPKNVPALSLRLDRSLVGYKTLVHLTAALGRTDGSRSLTIYAEVNGSGKDTVIASGKVSAEGQLAVAYTALESTSFRAVFGGDAEDAAVQASAALSVSARVQAALSGQYGTRKTGGVSYRLYHRAGKVTVAITVTPAHPGGCVELQTQEFYRGRWHASATTGCATLNRASRATASLTAAKLRLGYPYRVRAEYLSKSAENASADSGWQYFMIEK